MNHEEALALLNRPCFAGENPDYYADTSLGGPKAQAWFVTDAGRHEDQKGIYLWYQLDDYPHIGRGFTMNAEQAKKLIDDLINALQKHGVDAF